MDKNYDFHKGEVNTLVCEYFSDGYYDLNRYILTEGIKTESRIGTTYETLNFKIVIEKPLYRCTVSLNRNSNIFFHLAESLWVLTGRNDLEFIEIFNKKFPRFSDDNKTLHGAYGKRIRKWNAADNEEPLDQLFKITSILNSDPDLRRSVISLWNPLLDLGNSSKDIPCNTQLVLRVKGDDFHLTIFNRSNDLHWGYIANIFQFSFLGEIIALLIDKKYVKQTHLSQSLHIYTENELINKVEESDTHNIFYSRYKPKEFTFDFENSTHNFPARFSEIDATFKNLTKLILEFYRSENNSLPIILKEIDSFNLKSKSVFEIGYLLILFVSYQKELRITKNENELRMQYANYLIEKNNSNKFNHGDYFGLALNYFVKRMNKESKLRYTITDFLMGQY